jgi:hypothetical protein
MAHIWCNKRFPGLQQAIPGYPRASPKWKFGAQTVLLHAEQSSRQEGSYTCQWAGNAGGIVSIVRRVGTSVTS